MSDTWARCDDADEVRWLIGQAAHDQEPRITDDCPRCGHLMVLHSRTRACIGCRLEPEAK